MTLSQRIKSVRNESRKSQKEVADIMGVSQQSYQEFEVHADKSQISTINRFCSAIGVDVAFLLSDIPISEITINLYGKSTYNQVVSRNVKIE